jgi:hypothetical protein
MTVLYKYSTGPQSVLCDNGQNSVESEAYGWLSVGDRPDLT